jgi:hypothetical protein
MGQFINEGGSVSIFQYAGLWTDRNDPQHPAEHKAQGFRWIAQQATNEGTIKPTDLHVHENLGYQTGVWGADCPGVSLGDSATLARIANERKADLYIMNIERTLTPVEMTRVVDGAKTYPGPKAFCDMVGNALTQPWPILLNAGWDVMLECFENEQANLTPATALDLALRAGIPRERLSICIGAWQGARGFTSGKQYATDLQAAGFGSEFNVYMVEQRTALDFYEELSPLAKAGPGEISAPPPSPPTVVDPYREARKFIDQAYGALEPVKAQTRARAVRRQLIEAKQAGDL